MGNFKRELEALINKYSKENGSHTPDFILAEYLNSCLELFDKTMQDRRNWYTAPANSHPDLPSRLGIEEDSPLIASANGDLNDDSPQQDHDPFLDRTI